MLLSWKNPLRALPVLLLLAAHAGAALGAAGNVQFVIGDVKLIRAGATQALQKGAEINEGDRIVTGAGASAQVKMVDGGFIAIRPNTDMGFDTYRYSGKEDGSENALVSLVRGGFRTITGVIGRTNKQNYLIRTETATIGIRGTDHEPMVILPPAPGQTAIAAAGTYDKVNVGVAFIRTDAGSIDIQRNQVGFAPITKAAPVILPRIPPFYKPTPAPGPQKAKEEAAKETAAAPAGAAAETAAAAPAAAEAPAQIRDTAVVDPASTVTAAPASAPIATAPAAVAPVVEITATSATGEILNTTTQTQTTAGGTTAPITTGPVIGSPIIASSNYGYGVLGAVPITGGVELLSMGSQTGAFTTANTNFVLSDNKLVEILQSQYQRYGLTSPAPVFIANANIKFSGGTAADVYSDPNGTFYMGRWSGGQIAVTDLATTSPMAPFTDMLGVASAHWLVGLTPGILAGTSINNVQQLYGQASYSLAAATHPTDGFGNVGTLNSATLNADFSAQTVDSNLSLSFSSADPANLSTRNLSLTAAATKMPIQKGGFGAAVIAPMGPGLPGISGLSTVSCSGADCAAGGYFGAIGGGFGGTSSGAVGTGVGLNYGFTALPTSGAGAIQPFEDYISGAAVLSTSAAPTAGTSAVPVTGGTGSYRHFAFGPQTVGTTTYHSGYTLASGATMNAQNYVFDASGNLVRMHNSAYSLSERGTSGPPSYTIGAPVAYTGTPGGLPSSPLSAAMVSFSGGTAPDGNYNDSVNGIRIGRYAGGTITTTDLSSGFPLSYSTPLGSNSYNWTVRELPASIPTTGSFEYATAYATKPTDSLGNVGTLNYATLSADFSKQTVSPAVGITINNQNLASAATDVPIGSAFGFDVSSSPTITTSGGRLQTKCYGSNCAPAPVGGSGGYGARITGALAGSGTAGGAFFRYLFDTRYDPGVAAGSPGGIPSGETRPVNDYIQGAVAFTKGAGVLAPAPATAASGSQVISTTYFALGAAGYMQSWNQDYWTSPSSYTSPFGVGSPNSVSDFDPGEPTPHSETLTGGTVATPPTNANSAAATGISFGRYTGGTVSGIDWKGSAFSQLNQGSYAWVKGPELFPYHLGGAMTGTAKYVLDGGTPPGTTTGGTGTLNSAVLAVDFNRAAVGVDLSVTASGSTFTATSTSSGALTGNPTTSLRLTDDNGFFGNGYSTNPALHDRLYVSKNGVLAVPNFSPVSGFVRGQLMGPGLNGAGMTYAFQDNFTSPGFGVSGAAAFALDSYTNNSSVTTTGTSAIDANNVPYMLGIMATGLIADPAANPANAPASIDSEYLAKVEGGFNSSFRIALDPVNGLPMRWDGDIPITTPPNPSCSPTPCPAYVNNVPARFSIDPASFVATGATPGPGQIPLPTGKIPATLLESGRDAATGISWGRYGGGVIAVFDRIGGGFAPITVDLKTQNWHGIFSPLQTGPTVLPATGTFTYSKVGGTSPTDNLGSAAGTLNAATLVADFAAQTVNAGVNLTVNGQTWAAGANAIPIWNRLYFQAARDSGGGPMNICIGSTCGTVTIPTTSSANTTGRLAGGFTGSSGQGVGMAYSLNQGGATGTTVSGVAAFKR